MVAVEQTWTEEQWDLECCSLSEFEDWARFALGVSAQARQSVTPKLFCQDAERSFCRRMRAAGRCAHPVRPAREWHHNEEVAIWLRDLLTAAGGALRVTEVMQAGRLIHVSRFSVYRAATALQVDRGTKHSRVAMWRLPQ